MNGKFGFATLLFLVAAVGCARSSAEQTVISKNNEYILAAEPTGAIDVLDIREKAQDGESVLVCGRLGGGVKPWIDGRAAFLLLDERVQSSCDKDECEDGCAECAQQLLEATMMVKFVDAQGKVLAVDARELLGLKENHTVVVQGTASRDKSGNVSIIAKGIHVRS